MNIELEVVSVPDFPVIERQVSNAFTKGVFKLTPLGANYLKKIVPSKTRKLQNSIGHKDGEIFTTSDYYKYLDKGTRPHIIEGLLVFKIHGVTIFSRNVDHPGTVPLNLTDRTVDEIEKNIPQVVRDIDKVTR